MASKSIYPSIPAPGHDPASQQATLDAMRQTLTMLIINAQKPNSGFAPSSASQVFVTYDALQKLKVAGPPGQQGVKGEQGLPGPPGPPGGGGITDAPADSNTYGRNNNAWVQVLASANAKFTTLPTNAVDDTAAQAAGVPLNGVYRNGSALMVRVV